MIDSSIAYNYRSDKWGRGSLKIHSAFEYVTPGITYDNVGAQYASYDAIPAVSYDSGFFVASEKRAAVFNTAHVVQTLDGPSVSSSFETWDIGADGVYSFISRFRPRFNTAPDSGSAINSWRENLGDPFSSGANLAASGA